MWFINNEITIDRIVLWEQLDQRSKKQDYSWAPLCKNPLE